MTTSTSKPKKAPHNSGKKSDSKPPAPRKVHHGKETDKPKKRAYNFKKGLPANPKGRPLGTRELAAYAREYTEEAMEFFVSVMRDDMESAKDRLKAADMIMERGWGKAMQAHLVKIDPADGNQTTVQATRNSILGLLSDQFHQDEERREIIDVTPAAAE